MLSLEAPTLLRLCEVELVDPGCQRLLQFFDAGTCCCRLLAFEKTRSLQQVVLSNQKHLVDSCKGFVRFFVVDLAHNLVLAPFGQVVAQNRLTGVDYAATAVFFLPKSPVGK